MTSTLVDSNVLIDVFERDPVWFDWSARMLEMVREDGPLILNVVVASEVARAFKSEKLFEGIFSQPMFAREEIPWEVAFRSSVAHAEYRRRGGMCERTLPDFLIGSHAATRGHRLLTRDAARYRTYFPEVEVLAPDTHP